jgi:hypothetical protein
MSLKHNTVHRTCQELSRHIAEAYPELQTSIIAHRTGKLEDSIAEREDTIRQHPAGQTALRMLNYPASMQNSFFHGLATNTTSRLFGIIKKHQILGLITINSDLYDNLTQALGEIYHLSWHAIDMAMLYRKPFYSRKFQNGPLVPKRSPLNLARANMKADVFAATMLHFDGHEDASYKIASLRARQALERKSTRTPENYPFVICYETTQQVLDEIGRPGMPKHKMIDMARKLSLDIGATYDEDAIEQWWGFCIPAQDMIWRDIAESDVLNAAVNTSNDAFVRAIGILMSEITGIPTRSDIQLEDKYNAYASTERNHELHKRKMDETFEIVMARGIQNSSSRPFLDAANDQNIDLRRGRILGWCATALQAAARAFDAANARGSPPDQAARLEFHGMQNATSWDIVNELGQKINNQRRQGYTVTLHDIQRFCDVGKRFGEIKDSLQQTLDDPQYQKQYRIVRKLDISPELQPEVAPDHSPEIAPQAPGAMPAAAPTPGGGGGTRQPVNRQQQRQGQKNQQARQQASKTSKSGNKRDSDDSS